jgi:hypothetical protein
MDAVGLAEICDSRQLLNRLLTVTVVASEYNGKPTNDVKGYSPKRTGGQPLTQATYATPQATTGPANPVWLRTGWCSLSDVSGSSNAAGHFVGVRRWKARWYQAESNEAAWQFMADGRGNPLIVLPTAAGKSIVIGLLYRAGRQVGAACFGACPSKGTVAAER